MISKSTNKLSLWLPRLLTGFGLLLMLQITLNAYGIGVWVKTYNTHSNKGIVTPGQTLTHAFRIVNYSARTIELIPEPGCGCTIVDQTRSRIAPFSSKTLTATVDTDGMRSGKYHKNVMLKFRAGAKQWTEEVDTQFQLQ